MDYKTLLIVANKRIKELGIEPNSSWFDKKTLSWNFWRTRMYGYITLRMLKVLKKNNPLKVEEFIRKSKGDNNRKPVWLYVHIPFCTKKCPFCFYYVVSNPKSQVVDRYIEALKKNLDMWIRLVPDKLDVVAIHFGGGTPTYLSTLQLHDLLGYINKKLDVKSNIFYTFESSPQAIIDKPGIEKLKELLNNGVNRLSIGVQSFDNSVLKISKRAYNSKEVITSIKIARKMGFKNINIDLLLGLPGETTKTWYNTLKVVKELKPESVTLYPLSLFPDEHPYMHEIFEKNPNIFPDTKSMLTMNIMLSEFMSELNYTQNRPGSFTKSSEYFWYPKPADVLPLGTAAWSFYNDYHLLNVRDINAYFDFIDKGVLPIPTGRKLPKDLILKKELATEIQFLNWGGLNKEKFKEKFGLPPEEAFGEVLIKLKREGMVEDKEGYIKLSPKGIICVDSIAKYIYSSKLSQTGNF